MKRLLISLSLITFLCTVSSYARSIPADIMKSFYQSFDKASNITVNEEESFYRIGFTQDGQNQFVYYDLSGNQIGKAGEISFSSLPAHLQSDFKNRFGNTTVVNCYKIHNISGVSYCIITLKGSKQLTLHGWDKKWKIG